MPTTLPHRKRATVKRSPTRTLFDILFNGAMLVSALILAFVVLLREEQYALGRPGIMAAAMQQSTVDTTGETLVIPPLN